MKEEINLLPPPHQQLRFRRLYGQRVSHLLRRLQFVVSFLCLVGALLYGTLTYIQNSLQLSAPITAEESAVQTELLHTNTLLQAVTTRVRSTQAWSPGIVELLSVLPKELRLTSLMLEEKTGMVTLKGVSSSREAIRTFEQAVKKLAWVEKLEAPLKNFATGDQASFEFVLTRKAITP